MCGLFAQWGMRFTAVLVASVLSICAVRSSAQTPDFRPIRVVEEFPAIRNVPVISASDVNEEVQDNELVLGVVINGKARAYPINMLTSPTREIINDELGGMPIAATWCHLCHNGVVYTREVDGQPLNFAVSGRLWNRNLVMIDEETRTLWSHLLGKAMRGKLEGTQLKTVSATMLTWRAWRHEHPKTTVINLPRTTNRYVKEFYVNRDSRFVFGWLQEGKPYSASFEVLRSKKLINVQRGNVSLIVTFDPQSSAANVFSSELNGKSLEFVAVSDGRMKDTKTESVWNSHTGVAIDGELKGTRLRPHIGIVSYARTWKVFHPESESVGTAD